MSLLSCTAGSRVVTVTIPDNGSLTGDYVLFSGITTSLGGIPASELNTNHLITVISVNQFTITVSTAATFTDSYNGNLTATFDIHSGNAVTSYGYGWGTAGWGLNKWGESSIVPVVEPARLISQDRYYDNLIFCIRGGDIYYWQYNPAFDTRAVPLYTVAGASDVPLLVSSILMSQQDQHLITFGGTNYLTNTYDPLLIRWSNQNEPWNFTPTATNSAGYLRATNGSEIVQAVRTRQEILVFTDSALYSMQFLGTQEVYGLQQLADNTSIISPAAATTINNVTYWMGVDKFYVYNGRVDTLPCTLRQYIFNDLNRVNQNQIISGTNEEYNEVIWFYPSANSNELNRYVIFNFLEGIWYYGNLERTAWLDSPLRTYPQASATNGWMYDQENGVDADGAPLEAFISSGDMDIEDGDQFMLIRRVIPDINFRGSTNNSATAELTISPRNFPGQAYQTNNLEGTGLTKNVTTSSTALIDQYTNQVFIRARGRQFSFKISSAGLGVQWQLGMPRVDARPDGKRG